MPASGRQIQKRQAELRRQQRVGIGADRVEGDVAEVEQAGEADHDVQPPAEHDVGQHQDAEVELVAPGARDEGQHDSASASSTGATNRPARAQRRRRARAGRAAPAPAPRAARARASIASRPAKTSRRPAIATSPQRWRRTSRAGRRRHRCAARPAATNSAEGDQRRDGGIRERCAAPDAGGATAGGIAQTFSTSGRPSRPVGRKISTSTRIEKAATSLYSTEK